jgi:hypothetical protein
VYSNLDFAVENRDLTPGRSATTLTRIDEESAAACRVKRLMIADLTPVLPICAV